MAKRKGYQGGGYAALFFVLFFIIERALENLIFGANHPVSVTVTTFILVLLAIVSWYLGRKVAESKEKK